MTTERRRLTQARIGVLMGGQSSEREVSLRTGAAVHGALCRLGYDAVTIDVGPTLSRDLQDQKIAVAFLALHGPGGEDGSIQGFLETLGIPVHGLGCSRQRGWMHKVTTKTVLAAHADPRSGGSRHQARGTGLTCAGIAVGETAVAGRREAGIRGVDDRRHDREETGSVD